ncbi:MAG: hypothetical protein U0414_25875 [Polyangiaceae bacterium]
MSARQASAGFAFVLNLDAERELAGTARDPFRALETRPALRSALDPLVLDARVIDRASPPNGCDGLRGLAFMATPAALAALARAGALLPVAPALETLRAVNHRGFSYALEGAPPGVTLASTMDEVARALARPSPTGAWLLKRPFGFAGKGRRRAVAFDAAVESFARRALVEEGGVGVEPLLERRLDAAIHGFLREDGGLSRGSVTISTVSLGGSFLGAELDRGGALEAAERRALELEAERVGEALFAAGYIGPFGVDAFRYADPRSGAARFLSRCEINARYTMAWAIGMDAHRPDLEGRNSTTPP